MRVTTTAMYRNYNNSINSVHSELNKSMNRVASGKQYESAAENPLAYYQGKKIDSQYQNVLSQRETITNIKNRLYQQELGARSIQSDLAAAKTKVEYIISDTNNSEMSNVDTIQNEILEKAQNITSYLNTQYQGFYVFGGNDNGTVPFSLSSDGTELNFTHTYTDGETETITFKLEKDTNNNNEYTYTISGKAADGTEINTADCWKRVYDAMIEQGRVDIGYGTIEDQSTLLDTYTGGLNVLTGLTSDTIRNMNLDMTKTTDITTFEDKFTQALLDSSLGQIGIAADTMENYMNGTIDKGEFSSNLGSAMDKMTTAEHNISVVYSDLGTKYNLLETTDEKLADLKVTLEEQYEEILGADAYESITSMYSYQYAYNASLQIGSQMMQSTLFDFI